MWHLDEHSNAQWTPWLMELSFKNDTDMRNHPWLSYMTSIALHRKLESYELAMSFRRNDLKITPSIQCSLPIYDSVPWLQRKGIKKKEERGKKEKSTMQQAEIYFNCIVRSLILPATWISLRWGRLARTTCGQCHEYWKNRIATVPSICLAPYIIHLCGKKKTHSLS